MPSQSRTSHRPVSLPSIHELFPEHLMHSPQSPRTHFTVGQRHTTSSPHYRSPAQPTTPFARPGEDVSRVATESAYHYPSHYSNDNYVHSSRATSVSRPLGAPHASARPAGGPSSFPPSQQMLMPPHHRDNNRHDHLGHPIVSIPLSHSERTPKGQVYPGAQSNSLPGSTHLPPPHDDPENLTDDDTPSTGPQSGIPRKHICPICHKAFNRPSSLKIHYNTHTGATPFRCPWPKCGREFNVNSNMRRHYRNHTTNTNQESQDDGARRRRRRSSAGSSNPPPALPVMQQSVGEARPQPLNTGPHHHASPSQYDAPPPHQYSQYRVYDYTKDYPGMDLDDADDYPVSEDPHRSRRLTVPMTRASQTLTEPRGSEKPASRYPGAPTLQLERTLHHHHSRSSTSSSSMRIRALTPGSSFHSSSPSPSPSPSLSASGSLFDSPPLSTLTSPANSPAILPRTHGAAQQYQYSPSMPYLRGSGDPHVSTALRPAFNSGSTR